jgi:cyanate lyase
MTLVKTTDPDFCRDESSGAVINTNITAYKLYKQQRRSHDNVTTLNSKIDFLEKEITELKTLLKDIVREKYGDPSK